MASAWLLVLLSLWPSLAAEDRSCSDVLAHDAGGSSCGGRIEWLESNEKLDRATAENAVGHQFPEACGACVNHTVCGPIAWHKDSSVCLHVKGNDDATVHPVVLASCSSDVEHFNYPPGNFGAIRWSKHPNMCLDVTGGGTENGNGMQVYQCGAGDNPNMQFIVSTGPSPIQWHGHNKCLAVVDDSPVTWECDGSKDQDFDFVPVAEACKPANFELNFDFVMLCSVCAAGVLIVVLLWAYHKFFAKQSIQVAKVAGIRLEAGALSIHIMEKLSGKSIENYQFRGIRQKDQTVAIKAEELGLQLANGTPILEGVSAEFPAGRMAAIMGPSGAGKTSFMNVLCGKATYGEMSGTVYINGEEMNIRDLRNITGFVPQDDVVHEELSVRENIDFSAQLRNGPGSSERRIQAIVEDVLHVMQLTGVQNSIVGGVSKRGISGGQRKRVNIGLELAASPTLLFLDEPTSGLDATSSLVIVRSLKRMADLGMTIIMVIHQPRYGLFTLFDDVLLLGKGGQTVFLGPPSDAVPYFENLGFAMPANENAADWIMDCIAGEVKTYLVQDFRPSMFASWWKTYGRPVEARRPRAMTRGLSPEETTDIVMRLLKEEWTSLASEKEGMSRDVFAELLTQCSGTRPDDDVVVEVMMRAAGRGARIVYYEDFLHYLLTMLRPTANDRLSAEADMWETSSSASDDSEDLALGERPLPHAPCQYMILLHRGMLKWWRMAQLRCMFFVVLEFGALTLAVMDRWVFESPTWSPAALLNAHITTALLISVYSLNVFSKDRDVYWREASHGLNRFAFLMARMTVGAVDWMLMCLYFAGTYYIIVQPSLDVLSYIFPFFLVGYVASGFGYAISCSLDPSLGPFLAALLSFTLGGILGLPDKMPVFLTDEILWEPVVSVTSFTRWSVQMSFLDSVDSADASCIEPGSQEAFQWSLQDVYKEASWNTQMGYWWTSTVALLSMGSVLRVIAYLGLRFTNRNKQV